MYKSRLKIFFVQNLVLINFNLLFIVIIFFHNTVNIFYKFKLLRVTVKNKKWGLLINSQITLKKYPACSFTFFY